MKLTVDMLAQALFASMRDDAVKAISKKRLKEFKKDIFKRPELEFLQALHLFRFHADPLLDNAVNTVLCALDVLESHVRKGEIIQPNWRGDFMCEECGKWWSPQMAPKYHGDTYKKNGKTHAVCLNCAAIYQDAFGEAQLNSMMSPMG